MVGTAGVAVGHHMATKSQQEAEQNADPGSPSPAAGATGSGRGGTCTGRGDRHRVEARAAEGARRPGRADAGGIRAGQAEAAEQL